MKVKNRIFSFLILAICTIMMHAQQVKTVRGLVIDKSNEPVIGATILIKGSHVGTTTDLDGKFSIEVAPGKSVLVFSYLGMKTQEIQYSGQKEMNVQLLDDTQSLEEVVVIGYGSAKAKDLTSPIAVVKGDAISSLATSSPMSAIQGMVSGVSVVKSNAPGASPKVKIRGIGSFSSSNPLYVVDGMFYDNIDFLNNADIQEMSVLKDASAAAIYGVRAANGVIIVTTKKGTRRQEAKVTYEGFIGTQKATNVLKMANAQQYATMMLEADFDTYASYMKQSIDKFGGSYAASDFHNWSYGANTDWYKELLKTAVMTNHGVNISGGSDRATYAVGLNYLYQDGIMDSENNYKRLNFRANLDFDVNDWLKVGASFVTSDAKQKSPNSRAWQQAFNLPSIIPVYSKHNTEAFPENYASPSEVGFTSNFNNPIATAKYNNNLVERIQVLPTFYAELSFLKKALKFKTQYSQDFTFSNSRDFKPAFYVSSWQQSAQSTLTKSSSKYHNYVWDNTLTYQNTFGKHGITAMLGQSMRQQSYRILSGTAANVPDEREEYWYLTNGDSDGRTVTDNGYTYRGLSYFARVNYDFDGKYLLNITTRRDGSSKYNDKWGLFPSVGAAWIMSEENFLKQVDGIDFLKIRASWGKLGNDNVAASDGYAGLLTGSNFYNGVFGNSTCPGYYYDGSFSWLAWEEVEEWNAGVNFITLNNRLNVDVDFFNRITNKAIIRTTLPLSNSTLAGNNGKIANKGFEINLGWNDSIGDFRYNIGANLTFLHNEVLNLNGAPYIYGGSAESRTINLVGESMNSYYGYKVAGVYQTESEIANDVTAQNIIKTGIKLEPGDLKYVDLNGDQQIDDKDRTCLGSNIPSLSYGLNLGFQYKNLEFNMAMSGISGNKIYNRKRALRYAQDNYNFDYDMYVNRWTGEGSTNSYMSAKALTKNWNKNNTSDFYVESGAYFRIQNINLAYNFKNIKMGNYTLPNMKISLAAENPLTIFSANSFTPEVTSEVGWDTEVYPMYSTYTFGLSLEF